MLMVCRAPPGAEAANFSVGPPAGDSEAAAVAWDAYWGFDCVAQRGLCDAMYSHLGIAQSSWQALKMLPSVSALYTFDVQQISPYHSHHNLRAQHW